MQHLMAVASWKPVYGQVQEIYATLEGSCSLHHGSLRMAKCKKYMKHLRAVVPCIVEAWVWPSAGNIYNT